MSLSVVRTLWDCARVKDDTQLYAWFQVLCADLWCRMPSGCSPLENAVNIEALGHFIWVRYGYMSWGSGYPY